ncbi:hypothetical protein GSI_07491 [Ganoderma sinense ZZ0214-1]|uniref:Uncharacterized protein n=1 Tax=Ganoderma sinense ZZ0214-1 TaxID=1077348 RepID=A0A2G8S975_9APHY|nr:hypothetical protein GSI_07491 [Ganoderma sinense ZZ0214-1]
MPSLNFAAPTSHLGPGSHRTLPAFIASIGAEVHMGLHFVDSAGAEEPEDIVHPDEAASDGVDSAQEHEGEISSVDIPTGQEERVEDV